MVALAISNYVAFMTLIAMVRVQYGSHTVFSIHLHLVWITKYRKKLLTGPVAIEVRDMIRSMRQRENVDIMNGHVSQDHVHLFISLPPQVAISHLVQKLKGKTAYKLLNKYPHLRKEYWERLFGARGYFCCSSGNVTDDIILQYIEDQNHGSDDDFTIEDVE